MEANAANAIRVQAPKIDPKNTRGGQGIREQAFAARFVDGRLTAIGHRNAEALAPGRDRRRQTGGATANYEDVRLWKRRHSCSLSRANLWRK